MRGDPRAFVHPAQVLGGGGQGVSVAATARAESTAAVGSMQWITQRLGRIVLHVVVIGLTLAWVIPTAGLILRSLWPVSPVAPIGWWAGLSPAYPLNLRKQLQAVAQSKPGP